MYHIIISAQELQNLKAFMSRINLSAKEVNSYVEVMNKLALAKRIEEEKAGKKPVAEKVEKPKK